MDVSNLTISTLSIDINLTNKLIILGAKIKVHISFDGKKITYIN